MVPSSPRKVVYCITSLTLGGAQTVLVHIVKHLDRRRYVPLVVCLSGGDSDIAADIRAEGVDVIDLQMAPKWRLDAIGRYIGFLQREKPALIHASLFHANLISRFARRLAKVPHMISWRQNIEIGGVGREWLNRWTVGMDDRVVAVCEPAREAELARTGLADDQVIVIPNCVDVDKFASVPTEKTQFVRRSLGFAAETPLALMVGRLHEQKGLPYLIEAMVMVRRSLPNAQLLVVGDGDERLTLEAQTGQAGLTDAITFTGARHDIPQLLHAADLFVLPSLWEGLPLAVLEAMAAGLPVVATAVGGTPEAVVDGHTGRLIPPADATALAQAIIAYLSQPALAKANGQNGQQRVIDHFSAAAVTQRLMALYDDVLSLPA